MYWQYSPRSNRYTYFKAEKTNHPWFYYSPRHLWVQLSLIPEQPFVSLAQSQRVVKYGDSSIYHLTTNCQLT